MDYLFTHVALGQQIVPRDQDDHGKASTHGEIGHQINPHGGCIELFLFPAIALQQMLWYVLSCLWDGVSKRTLAANRKE